MDTPVWDTPDPTKSEKHLSQKKENRARARARAAGRPYPNLIDNMAVSKGVRLDKIASSPAGMRYLKEAPLKGNEFYHGTTKDSVAAIRSEGYSLKQKNKRFGSHFGPGVYGSTHKHYAQSFADLHAKRTGGKPEVLRMAIPKNSKLLTVDGWDNTIKTPQATRKGYAGISATLKHDKSKYNITTIANPKNVKIVNNRYRPTKQAGKDAAVVATVGGAGYGAYKVKKFDSPAWTRSAGKNPEGGLNAKGRASAKAQGHNLKPPVKSGDNPRRASFLARMGGMPGPEHKPNGEPTRLLLSLQKWGASSKEDAKQKAAAMSKSWEEVSKVFPQRAILREGSRRTRVMVTHVHATGKPHLGIIHPQRGQEITHRDNLTFIKNKASKPKVVKPAQPKPVQLDLFGEPLRKSMEYDVSMSQSRFGGASNVGYSFEEFEKAKKRKKPSLNPQQKIFRDLARMEAEHGQAMANGHGTAPRKVAAIARGYNQPPVDAAISNMNRDYLKHQRFARGAKVAGVAAIGAGLIGATAYGLHRRNRLSDVTKGWGGAGGAEAAIARARMDAVFEDARQHDLKSQLNRRNFVRGAKIAGGTAVGAGLIGAAAYGRHRRNRLSDVTKASPGAGRVLEGASDAVRGARQSGTRSGQTSGEILGRIRDSAAKDAKAKELFGPRKGAALREISPARVRTKVVSPGGQGGTFAVDRKAMTDEASEAFRRQSIKGKELVLRPKAGLPVDARPPVPKVKKPGTDLVRVGSSASTTGATGTTGATRTTGSSLVPVRSAPPVQAPNYGREANYMPHAAAAAAIGSYGGYKVSKRLSEISKAYDEYGNPVKSGMASGSGSTALGLAGAGTAAYGVKTMRNAGALPRTAPIAEKVAEAANNKAIANSTAARNTVALNQAKLTSAKATRPMFNGSRAAKRTLIESQRQSHMVDRQAQKTAGKLVGTQAALNDIPGAMKASRNFGAAAVLGGTALAAGVLHNKTRGGN